MAAGDWISVSVEIERWNLLVCQLSDLQALTAFISRLTAANHNNSDNSGPPELSVIGKCYILRTLLAFLHMCVCGYFMFLAYLVHISLHRRRNLTPASNQGFSFVCSAGLVHIIEHWVMTILLIANESGLLEDQKA